MAKILCLTGGEMLQLCPDRGKIITCFGCFLYGDDFGNGFSSPDKQRAFTSIQNTVNDIGKAACGFGN